MTLTRKLLFLSLTLFPYSFLLAQEFESTNKPNVIFITVDDLNDWIEPLGGHPQVKTPNFNELARRGMTFTNAHSSAVVCGPSRASFLSGLSPTFTGFYVNGPDWREIQKINTVKSLPHFFKDAGYKTTGAGKFFHTSQNDIKAWDIWYPRIGIDRPNEIVPGGMGGLPKNKNPYHDSFDWYPLVAEDSATGDGQIANWITSQIKSNQGEEQFIGFGFRRPHAPFYVPEKYFDLYPIEAITMPQTIKNDLDDVPKMALKVNGIDTPSFGSATNRLAHEWVIENNQWSQITQAYLASVSFIDALLGTIIEAVDNNPKMKNTIIIVIGDHGFHIGEKLSYQKKTLWRESTRVPMIIVAPGVTTPGSISSIPVSLLDIYPTLVELSGLDTPNHLDGESIVPILANPEIDWDRFAVSNHGYMNFSVTSQSYQYIRYSDNSEELYNITNDPNEFKNLASLDEFGNIKLQLKEQLPKYSEPDVRGISTPWRE
ncbi:MAG: hypothetical protein CBC38_05270 [Gammaproteobacteria bacterium TMED78]|nr:MAG: hypothetical protein CBC38_05270 [Gammaproteobacteria bacterium TMED78]|tara:strand:+ start:33141 stop:34598 length:1458 start_codon:yes stop_codon:yes gene_type:complete